MGGTFLKKSAERDPAFAQLMTDIVSIGLEKSCLKITAEALNQRGHRKNGKKWTVANLIPVVDQLRKDGLIPN